MDRMKDGVGEKRRKGQRMNRRQCRQKEIEKEDE